MRELSTISASKRCRGSPRRRHALRLSGHPSGASARRLPGSACVSDYDAVSVPDGGVPTNSRITGGNRWFAPVLAIAFAPRARERIETLTWELLAAAHGTEERMASSTRERLSAQNRMDASARWRVTKPLRAAKDVLLRFQLR